MSNNRRTIYNDLLQFCVSLMTEFYQKFVLERFSDTLITSSVTQASTGSPSTIKISDDKLQACIKRGLNYIKIFLKRLQGEDDGIPAVGVNIEAWTMENMIVNIVSHRVKLHRVSNFTAEEVSSKVGEGNINIKLKWPNSYLSETGLFNGVIDGKKVTGYGDFKVKIINLTIAIQLKFVEKVDSLEIIQFVLIPNFENVQVTVTGLEVEGGGNAEMIINQAIQRDMKQLKENLLSNSTLLSQQIQAVLKEKLRSMSKKTVIQMITGWCQL